MCKIRVFIALVCMLLAANAWGAGFKDDFDRADGNVGNGWTTQTDGTIKVQIVDNEVLIAGKQATAWARAGISRPVSGETTISFDFKADDVFNVHIRVDDALSAAYVEVYAWANGSFSYASSPDGAWPGWVAIAGSNMVAGEYNTLLLELKGTQLTVTLNGTVVGTVTNANLTSIESVLIASDADAGQEGSLHIDNVLIGKVIAGKAKDPSPAPDATDVPRDTALSWTGGEYASTHNVYLGTSFDDVNNAGVAQAVSKGQTGTTFQPAGLLEYSGVYFWRVDEVNAPPDSTVLKGDVWSFTAEPYVYQVTNIKATASSSDKPANGPQKTVDGSGLVDGGHSDASADMWVTSATASGDPWIQYEFDRPYKLQEMRVWNYNTEAEPVLGYGFKDVAIDYSLDGTEWTAFGEVQFEQATGQSGYAPSAAIPLGSIYAKFIRFSPKSNWSLYGIKQYGLSEVQFFQIPVVARAPQPGDNGDGVSLEPTLTWRPGRETVSQKVYFSADRQAVVDGTAPAGDASGNSYQPGSLDYGRVYYWRVDEVNDAASPSTWTGDVWAFSTTESFMVDDFESYNDEEGQGSRIYENWLDGYADGSSGSMVGNLEPPFAERVIVHGGSQSMPLDYNNIVSPYYSEALRVFPSNQDWTVKGVTDLVLWVRGQAGPIAPVTEDNGKMTVTGEGSDIWNASDQFTYVYKTLSGDGLITARVTSVGTGSNSWAKGGVMIRDSLDAGSAFAMMVLTDNSDGAAGNGAAFQNRASTDLDMSANDATSNANSPTVIAPPYYVKIERKSSSISGSVSLDGTNWTQIGTTQYMGMTPPIYIGFCVTSGAPGENRTYTFDNINSSGASGSWQTKEVGLLRNNPQDLYVTVEDASNNKATVTNADLVTTTSWTEWRIPLSSFTGVNMARVKKLYLGVGSKTNPQPDGAGKIYVDDIQVGRRGSVDPGSANLQASYALEGDVLDGSGNGHDGTAMGDPVYVAGQSGQALQFDGAGGQYVECGTWNPSAATGQLTVAVWANWAGLSGQYQGLMAKRDTWAANDMMWQVEANVDTGALTCSRTDVYPASGNPVLPVGEWAHVAVTFDGTTAKFFVNAVETGRGAFSFGSDAEAGVHFGCCDTGGGNPFNGSLDELRIYDRALSSFELNFLAGRQ
jgi:hypothetical protein